MILNYRVELCRQCYYKRMKQCAKTDLYIHNQTSAEPGGECKSYLPVPWLPY
ncbi:hypothetical protein [Desulfitobacterium chlororespirans]|uniref:Uncharacterized protein n=1 Tax=Desulfitobacterium chlororespirans DSM 11544 TaxID=1121395 RepID=A0A1M7UH97_9FIRM|nr:hypothetical protein [Desulfitobacterium chlororespirans]SHN82314.1 hypothetical protein SAMN02745215_03791 [Desulfitobacterium chlororespirans DSM 11544]